MKIDFKKGRLGCNPDTIYIDSDISICIYPSDEEYSYFEVFDAEDFEFEKFDIIDSNDELQVEIKIQDVIDKVNYASIDLYVVEECLFEIIARTNKANINIEADTVKLEVSTKSGNMFIYEGVCMRLKSESGDIDLDIEACEDTEINASTISGDICVNVLGVNSYCGEVESIRGNIDNNLGDGGEFSPYLNLKTESGDIELTSVEDFDDEEDE